MKRRESHCSYIVNDVVSGLNPVAPTPDEHTGCICNKDRKSFPNVLYNHSLLCYNLTDK